MTTETLEALRAQLMRHEGVRLKPYTCSAGKLTLGVGRNLEARGITMTTALQMLDEDISLCLRQCSASFPWFVELDAIRQRALMDLCFNLGVAGLLTFRKFLAAMARGDYDTAADELIDSAWYKQVGRRAPVVVAMVRTGQEPEA